MDFDKLLGDECCLNVVNNAEKNIREAGLYNWAKRIYPIDEDWNVSLQSIFGRWKRIKN